MFTMTEQQDIARAIAAAEAKTSGEIVAVVARASSDYRFVPLLWASLIALAAPLPLILAMALPAYDIYAIQLAAFALTALLGQWQPLRVALVPKTIKHARARRNARAQFLAQNMHTTNGRTGVLIFVSVAERYAEIIADQGVYAKVDAKVWRRAVDRLVGKIGEGRAVDGFMGVIAEAGEVLAAHFPPATGDRDELPNHLIVLAD